MDDVIEYFDAFKSEEGKYEALPPYEEIINEAIKVGNTHITNARVNQLFLEYDKA
jgi:hypothetical protein